MKIIALGGAGAMGRLSVRCLAAEERVNELVIADYDLAAAEVLARSMGEKCRAVRIDVRDHRALTAALRGFDVALGTVGPFYKFEVSMIRACIEAGIHYVSICDDYDAAAAALDLDEAAQQSGITAITGVGWTPGITNMLARCGAAKLRQVDTMAVSWGCHAGDTPGKAVTLHTIHIFSGFVPSFQNGRTIRIPAGTGKERVRFPQPVGDVSVYHLGHPEPVTLPRCFPVRTVTLKGGLKEQYLNNLAILINRLGLTRSARQKDHMGRLINALLPWLEKITPPQETASACRVDITAKGRSGYTHRALGAVARMDLLTGLPCAVAALMLGEGSVRKKGVMGPEACLDYREFLSRLETGGIRFYDGDSMTEPLRLDSL